MRRYPQSAQPNLAIKIDYKGGSLSPLTCLYALRCISKKINVQMVCLVVERCLVSKQEKKMDEWEKEK